MTETKQKFKESEEAEKAVEEKAETKMEEKTPEEIKALMEQEEKEEEKEVKEIREMSKEEFLNEKERIAKEDRLAVWKPQTKLGQLVKDGKIKNIDEILDKKLKIMEPEIVDSLLQLKNDLILIGQSKGKFGGGKRRAWKQTQKKNKEGNVATFACMVIAGDGNGHVGLGYGKAKETLPAREKAIRKSRLNLIKIKRGCGGFDCSCSDVHSIPYKVSGKVSNSRIILIPAPRGTGLVIDDECKRILKVAGIKDIYSQTYGQTRTKINLAKACMAALEKLK